jgi:pimeloyl-ACP methyl ester carboxylesterase
METVAMQSKTSVRPFEINVHDEVLDDLKSRLHRTRWIRPLNDDKGWDYGVNISYLQELIAYWKDSYNWRDHEQKLNQFNQYKVKIGDCELHFIHHKGKGKKNIPLLLLHGWPDSFYRFHKIIPMLIDPGSAGIGTGIAFDVIVPSLPGFGFSKFSKEVLRDQPTRYHAGLLFQLMTEILGYRAFGIAGGDGGSPIAQVMAIDYPGSVRAIYITDLGWNRNESDQSVLSRKEKEYLEHTKKLYMKQSAYAMVQATKPQSLAYSLNDSPAGLAAWIMDRFYFWSNDPNHIENSFSKDELITNMMIYWVTQTISSSIRNYWADTRSPSLGSKDFVSIPVGLGLFPKDIGGIPPRELAERVLNVQHWKEMPSGGHFTAWEEPQYMASDLVEFFSGIGFPESLK